MKNGLLTVIVPAYNEQDNISAISAKVKAALEPEGIPYELLFVDDGSSDGTWQAIGEASRTDGAVRGLRFSRNFGKEGAMFAGLAEARGECVALIDADLQHPPEALGRMYKLWQQGEADIVEGKKLRRGKESLVYKAFAGLFYGMMKAMSGVDLANSSDFKLLDRKVVNTLMAMPERRTFFRAMSEWTGFKTAEVGFEVAPRNSGKSKFSARKLIKYALSSTASYTNVPLHFVTAAGVITFPAGLVLAVIAIVRAACGKIISPVLILSMLLALLFGIAFIGMGVLGYYLSRVYDELKARPRYIISEKIGGEGQAR